MIRLPGRPGMHRFFGYLLPFLLVLPVHADPLLLIHSISLNGSLPFKTKFTCDTIHSITLGISNTLNFDCYRHEGDVIFLVPTSPVVSMPSDTIPCSIITSDNDMVSFNISLDDGVDTYWSIHRTTPNVLEQYADDDIATDGPPAVTDDTVNITTSTMPTTTAIQPDTFPREEIAEEIEEAFHDAIARRKRDVEQMPTGRGVSATVCFILVPQTGRSLSSFIAMIEAIVIIVMLSCCLWAQLCSPRRHTKLGKNEAYPTYSTYYDNGAVLDPFSLESQQSTNPNNIANPNFMPPTTQPPKDEKTEGAAARYDHPTLVPVALT